MMLIFLLAYLAFETGSGVEVLEEGLMEAKQIPFLILQSWKYILIYICGENVTV